jgi:hypothetical protein
MEIDLFEKAKFAFEYQGFELRKKNNSNTMNREFLLSIVSSTEEEYYILKNKVFQNVYTKKQIIIIAQKNNWLQ